jgi:hypothetical protein
MAGDLVLRRFACLQSRTNATRSLSILRGVTAAGRRDRK